MRAAHFVDMTPDIRLSFKLMGRKVSDMLASGKYDKSEMLPVPLACVRAIPVPHAARQPDGYSERGEKRKRKH